VTSHPSHPWPFSAGFTFAKAKPWTRRATQAIPTVVEVKEDGWRALAVKKDRRLSLYSRGVSKVTGSWRDLHVADHKQPGGLLPAVADLHLCEGDAVELELVWPGHEATDVPTALASEELRGELEARCFGFPYRGGEALTSWEVQREYLEVLDVPLTKVWCHEANIAFPTLEEAYRFADAGNYEGFIVKQKGVVSATRWWKIKQFDPMDVVVVDVTDAEYGVTGKFAGLIGALVVAVRCRPGEPSTHEIGGHDFRVIAQVSGMDDAQREAMTRDREEIIGSVCEIHYQRKGSMPGADGDKGLRHPQFTRWRDDKPFDECYDNRTPNTTEATT
jgi:ATP-dependent DNA ligase